MLEAQEEPEGRLVGCGVLLDGEVIGFKVGRFEEDLPVLGAKPEVGGEDCSLCPDRKIVSRTCLLRECLATTGCRSEGYRTEAAGDEGNYTVVLFSGVGDISQGVFTGVLLNCSKWLRAERGKGVSVASVAVVSFKAYIGREGVPESDECSCGVSGAIGDFCVGHSVYGCEAVRRLVEDANSEDAEVDTGELTVQRSFGRGGLRFGDGSRRCEEQAKQDTLDTRPATHIQHQDKTPSYRKLSFF